MGLEEDRVVVGLVRLVGVVGIEFCDELKPTKWKDGLMVLVSYVGVRGAFYRHRRCRRHHRVRVLGHVSMYEDQLTLENMGFT